MKLISVILLAFIAKNVVSQTALLVKAALDKISASALEFTPAVLQFAPASVLEFAPTAFKSALVAEPASSFNGALNEVQKAMIQAKFLAGGVGCLKDHPLSISDIKTFRNKVLPDGENAKCFAECLFKKIGIMDDMGKVSSAGAKENAKQIFKNEEHLKKVDEFIEMCAFVNDQSMSESGMKGCDRAKMAFTCLVENAPKFGFDVDF